MQQADSPSRDFGRGDIDPYCSKIANWRYSTWRALGVPPDYSGNILTETVHTWAARV